jgi:hypothetical protein
MAVTKETKSAEVSTVLGKSLDTPVKFDYTYDVYETVEDVRAAGEWPNDKEILSYVNGKAERNALSGARAKAIADVSKEIRDTPEFKREELIKNIMSTANKSRSEAEALAALVLGQ